MADTRPRLDPDIRERVDTYAAKERRSRDSAVNYLLRQALDAADAHDGSTPTPQPASPQPRNKEN